MGGFFLRTKAYRVIKQRYPNVFASKGLAYAKAKAASGVDRFGWYGAILDLANGISDVKNVEQTNLYEFLNYLSRQIAVQDYQNGVIEQNSKAPKK